MPKPRANSVAYSGGSRNESSAAVASASRRSTLRVAAACSGQSTCSWWLVARGSVVARRPVRADVDGRGVAGVGEREVVRGVHREPLECGYRLLDGVAGLEQVADDDRDAETGAAGLRSAERERDGEAGVVDAVEHAPQAVAHPEHRPREPAVPDRRLDAVRVVVVVADERAVDDGLAAAGEQGRRVVQAQDAGGEVSPAGQLGDVLPRRDELRHVRAERRACRRVARAGGVAVAEVPGGSAGASACQRVWRVGWLRDRREGEFRIHAGGEVRAGERQQ